MAHVLDLLAISHQDKLQTYKNPMLKMANSIIFCFLGRFRLPMTGNGIQKTVISVTRLNPAMTYQTVKGSVQCPSKVEFQNFATGTQMRVLRKAIVIVQAIMMTSP